MKNQTVIYDDNFFITQRLKDIDESYFVVYNFDKQKYEVHSDAQKGGTYCFTVPFNSLDARTLTYAKKTRVNRRKEIIDEIDRENELREKRLRRDAVDRIKEVLE
jgi:hypothetical protein